MAQTMLVRIAIFLQNVETWAVVQHSFPQLVLCKFVTDSPYSSLSAPHVNFFIVLLSWKNLQTTVFQIYNAKV